MRTSFSKLSLLALPLAALTACQDYEPFSEAEVAEAAYNRNYTEAFKQAFGDIDPEQNWGFDPIPFVVGESTRGTNVESNIWIDTWHYQVPGGLTSPENPIWGWATGDISNYERAYVYHWFSTHQWPTTESPNLHDFFIQNVWGQPEHSGNYADGSVYSAVISKLGMDDMHILTQGKTLSDYDPVATHIEEGNAENFVISDISNYEQINNYNAGGSSSKEQIEYVFETDTKDFYYKGSVLDERHNNWTIQRINGHYYIAFDYWHNKKNADAFNHIAPDGYYNDWILRIESPKANKTSVTSQSVRVMCEDLGNTFDWDFNDVVFDITPFIVGNTKYAWIAIQAAGGTLPIWVGVDPSEHPEMEIHKLFGVSTTTPVNVNAPGGATKPVVTYRIELADNQWELKDGRFSCKPDEIPVYVPSRANISTDGNGSAIETVVLTAETGKAPQKFACPTTTHWAGECKHIENVYDNFWTWVADKNASDPWHHNEASFANNVYAASVVDGGGENVTYEIGAPEDETIKEWRTLWYEMVAAGGLDDSQFTQDRTYYEHPENNENKGNAYTTSFLAQAPYIYETVGQDDDPTAYASRFMDAILSDGYVSQEIVWPNVEYTVSVEVSYLGGGTVSGGGTAKKGEYVTIKATPNPNYRFLNWDDGNTDSERSVLVTKNQTYTANFERTYEEFTVMIGTFSNLTQETELIASSASDGEYLLEVTTTTNGYLRLNQNPYYTDFREAGTYKLVATKPYGQNIKIQEIGGQCIESIVVKAKASN